MKTRTVQLPSESQEDVDAKFQAQLDKKQEELDERESAFKKSTLARIVKASAKTPRRDVARVRVPRSERQSGLRF